MELVEAHKLRLGQVVVGQVETNIIFFILFGILSLDHIEQFFEHAKSKDYHLSFVS